ncbi:DUF63 domain-containing protein [Halobacteriales archaeon QH_7_68_42]|nr:MAG: DUF63 domain-containing protein [Halobacteriales archaeon QH_7_68_42]
MQVLPSGLVLPPLPYAAVLLVATAALVAALSRLGPAVTGRHVLAFVPWMAAGGALHALHQYGAVPHALDPLATAPAVYVSTFVAAAAVWVGALLLSGDAGLSSDGGVDGSGPDEEAAPTPVDERSALALGVAGGALLFALVVGAVAIAVGAGAGGFLWPPVGVLGAAAATGAAYVALRSWQPAVLAHHGTVVALFAHALDGVSTAIGVDVLGTGERTPIPRMIMEFAGALPTAPYLGRGWLFVLAKLAVAGGIVVLLADYVEEDPTEGNLLFAFVAAVGLGPAANNLTLFLLSGGV